MTFTLVPLVPTLCVGTASGRSASRHVPRLDGTQSVPTWAPTRAPREGRGGGAPGGGRPGGGGARGLASPPRPPPHRLFPPRQWRPAFLLVDVVGAEAGEVLPRQQPRPPHQVVEVLVDRPP